MKKSKPQYRSNTIKHYHLRKYKISSVLLFIAFVILIFNVKNILAYFTSTDSIVNEFTLQSGYTVIFNANGGTGSMSDQPINPGTSVNLNTNTFTNVGFTFGGWNTLPNGTGDHYEDRELITSPITTNSTVTLYAQWISDGSVARIENTAYPTLQAAIDAVATNGNTATTIYLLKDIEEEVQVQANKNIILDLQSHTIINDQTPSGPKTYPVIDNFGTLTITNGKISSNSSKDGVVNNEFGGIMYITNNAIIEMTATNGKQALYNLGTATISGNAYLSTAGNQRAAVQNVYKDRVNNQVVEATLYVYGGTIVAPKYIALQNDSTLTIGTEDGDPDITTPVIQGGTYGMQTSVDYDFFNGIIKGKTDAITGNGNVNNTETNYNLATSGEVIDGETYKTAYLAHTVTVTFHSNGASYISEATRNVEVGAMLGPLPTAKKRGYVSIDWVDSNNVSYNANSVITGDIDLYAQWAEAEAEIGETPYLTISEAMTAAQRTNNQTTVTLLKDSSVSATINISGSKNVILDLNNHTLSYTGGINVNVIKNKGTLTIQNGTITSNGTSGAVDNENKGKLYVVDCQITATGSRQAIYNKDSGSITTISGSSYLSSTSSERATVHNLNSGTVIIESGTIVSTNYNAVYNENGTLTIGVEGGGVSTTSPDITTQAINYYGILNNTSGCTLNFYDGIIKGKAAAISGTVTNTESGYEKTETLDNGYYSAILTAI